MNSDNIQYAIDAVLEGHPVDVVVDELLNEVVGKLVRTAKHAAKKRRQAVRIAKKQHARATGKAKYKSTKSKVGWFGRVKTVPRKGTPKPEFSKRAMKTAGKNIKRGVAAELAVGTATGMAAGAALKKKKKNKKK